MNVYKHLSATSSGCVEQRVYQKPVNDVDQLKQRLTEIWSGVQRTVVDEVIDEWRHRLPTSVRAEGRHFEHLL